MAGAQSPTQYPHPPQPPQQTFMPPPRQSPPNSQAPFAPPPNKRPRLSPDATSPYSSPQMTNGTLPNTAFTAPFYTHTNHTSVNRASLDATQPSPLTTTGTMGPPERPADKPTDVNDLSDVLVGSGIDLRAEEAALTNRAGPVASSATGDAAGIDGGRLGSFNAASSSNYFERQAYLAPNVPGDRKSFYGSGTFNQAAVSHDAVETQVEREAKLVARRQAESRQYHMRDPFLLGATLLTRMRKKATASQVALAEGAGNLLHANSKRDYTLNVHGPDGHDNIVVLKGQSLLYSNSSLTEICTLVSLAAQERMRFLIEDAIAIARGRRSTAHGVVPSDLRDVATGMGKPEEVAVPPPAAANPLKRRLSSINGDGTPSSVSSDNSPSATIAFPNLTTRVLISLAQSDLASEEARASKRSKRNVNNLLSGDGSRLSSASGTPAPGTPAPIGETAPLPDASRKGLTKKEQKQADARATEAQAHAAANNATNMALGGSKASWLGGKKISWMTSKGSTKTGFGPPPKPAPAAASSRAASTASRPAPTPAKSKTFGQFREDRESGAGVQLRDLMAVLEPDALEKRSMYKAYGRMNSRGRN